MGGAQLEVSWGGGRGGGTGGSENGRRLGGCRLRERSMQ